MVVTEITSDPSEEVAMAAVAAMVATVVEDTAVEIGTQDISRI